MENETLKSNVMSRIYVIYLVRTLLKPLAYELAFLAAIFGVMAFYVSLPSVVKNIMAVGVEASAGFIAAAFLQADIIVKLLFVAGTLGLMYMVYNLGRGIRSVVLRLA